MLKKIKYMYFGMKRNDLIYVYGKCKDFANIYFFIASLLS